VVQIQYQEWPDQGVPTDTEGLLLLLERANRALADTEAPGPMVVHCSAGIGRSGAFIATHIAEKLLEGGEERTYPCCRHSN